ncbi:competence/damage-inducible protein A [Shouchella shacheensis]|uniref:competence/damage-inducible protein A n=1 Tax=Shouchella shacheensis TaxID=1649580 RepID=UPI0007402C45|nr:competence/damage-inducible protein A [Shouchella shacheensis]
MNAEIIAVGSELLLGQIANTNGQFISKQLAEIGVDVYVHTVVGDNEGRLNEAIEAASARSDLVILTGGLGPTKDDLTKETVASLCGKKLVYDEEAMGHIEAFFARHNRKMTPNNRKQALVIEDSMVLANRHGMAPGMLTALKNGARIALLPGPPNEMKPMFELELKPLLIGGEEGRAAITSRVLRYFGIGESQLETDLEDLIDAQTNPTIAPLAGGGEVKLRLTVKHEDPKEALRLLDETEAAINARVGDYMYGYGETSLVAELTNRLVALGLTVASAESLTGGLFSSELAAAPGASQFLVGSVIAYQERVKREMLGVSEETIESNGVVSAACAVAMARGVKETMKSDIAISFTGVAGPDEQEGRKPGTVYIGIQFADRKATYELALSGTRNAIRKRAVMYGCFYLLNELKKE